MHRPGVSRLATLSGVTSISGGQATPTIVQTGTGYDLLMSGPLIADPLTERRIDAAPAIRRRAQAIDDGALARAFERIGRESFISLLGFAYAKTETPTAANVIAALRDVDAREVVLTMAGYYRRAYRSATPPDVIRDAIDGDRNAMREFQQSSFPSMANWQASLRRMLGRDVAEIRADLVAALERWLETGFGEMEPEIDAAQRADAERVRQLVATRELDDVLDQIAPGMTFASELGQSLVVLAPSTLCRPGWALTDFGPSMVIVYPAEPRLEPGVPPPRLVFMAKALGDELRVRALRELRAGPLSASELARRLGVPRTSLQHHLSILISAGLARLATDDAKWGRLVLRPEALSELSTLAAEWILDDGATPGERREGGSV
jgi:DNA-binding transcriptional ArsR family regulator